MSMLEPWLFSARLAVYMYMLYHLTSLGHLRGSGEGSITLGAPCRCALGGRGHSAEKDAQV